MEKTIRKIFAITLAVAICYLWQEEIAKATTPTGLDVPVVLDSKGKLVGPYVPTVRLGYGPPDGALRKIGGFWFALPVGINGFGDTSIFLYYPTVDCSGTAYSEVDPSFPTLVQLGWVSSGFLYYPDTKVAPISFMPGSVWSSPSPEIAPVCTSPIGGPVLNLFPIKTFNLSTLGFTAPFTLTAKGLK